jgi:predicted phosphodiesterase
MIGIMADSHGQTATLVSALKLLEDNDCRRIYHLGDVCDSAHPESVAACLPPLKAHGVITIKGNNEQAIVANLGGRDTPALPRAVLKWLQNLALVESYRNALFTHSMPFVRELGLACMIGDMGASDTYRFFSEFPQQILFRGHSHAPLMAWAAGREIKSQSLRVGSKFDLTGKIPCVVTCGALTRGYCMLWNPAENTIESLRFQLD